MKWRMMDGSIWNPDLPFWSEGWRNKGRNWRRFPRLVNFEIKYYDEGEYYHPVTGEPMDLVLEVTRKVRVATWKGWVARQRLEVNRHRFLKPDNNFRWSPVRKNTDLQVIEEITYKPEHPERRDRWFPEEWTFFWASAAFMVFARESFSECPTMLHKPFMHLQFGRERNITNFPLFWISANSQVVEFK